MKDGTEQRFTDRLFKSLFPSMFPYQYPSFEAARIQIVPKVGRGYFAPVSPNGTAYGQTGTQYVDAVRGVRRQG